MLYTLRSVARFERSHTMSGVYGVRRVEGSTSAGGSGGWRHRCRAPIADRIWIQVVYSGDFFEILRALTVHSSVTKRCSGRHPARFHVDRCTTAGPHGRVPRHAHADAPARIPRVRTYARSHLAAVSARAGLAACRGTRILLPVGRSPASPPGLTRCARPPGGAISRSDHTRH